MAKTTDKRTIKTSNASKQVESNPELDERMEQFAQTVDAENLQSKILEVTENKGARNAVFTVLGLIVLAILGVFGWQYFTQEKEQEAQKELYPVQYNFEKDSFNTVLEGSVGKNLGAQAIADEYGVTKAGNLAAFYAGVAYLEQGKFEEAVAALENFNADDYLVQARAYSLIGDAYVELNQLQEAVSYYKKAANHEPNDFFTPQYLMKLGFAYELQKDFEKAAQTYETIISRHAKSDEVNRAKRAMARAQGLKEAA